MACMSGGRVRGVDGGNGERNARSGAARWRWIAAAFALAAPPAWAADLSVSDAWTPTAEAGADVGLYMTVKNDAAEPDALLRATCPFANFAERRTVDVGEGGLADRAVANIPIAAHSMLTMSAKSYHVALLQTRDKLSAGESFTCHVAFRNAGAMDVKVTVSQAAPQR